MVARRKPLKVQPESEFGLIVRTATLAAEPLLVEVDAVLYEVEIHPAAIAPASDSVGARDRLFNIVGIVDAGEPTDIARNKDAYLAEAFDPPRS